MMFILAYVLLIVKFASYESIMRKACLTLYAPCIILQYVYKPTKCTNFCD